MRKILVAAICPVLLCGCVQQGAVGSMGSEMTQGKVLVVDGRVAVIDLGSRDRIRPGDVLLIRRQRQYLGKLRVRVTGEHTAIGECEEVVSQDVWPRPGDIVYELLW